MHKHFNTKPKQGTTDQRPSPLRRWSFYKSQNSYPTSTLSLKKNTFCPIIVSSSAFLFTFLTSFVVSSLLTSPSSSHAENLTALINASDYYVNLSSLATTSGLSFTIDATPDGALAAAKDTVSVSTNSPSGYNLYLSTATSNNSLINSSVATTELKPTSGSHSAPAPLSNNTWGYAIPNTVDNPTSFDSSYATPVPATTSLWAAVPIPENQVLLRETSTTSDHSTTDIYYGAKANLSLPSGAYQNTITYTAITENSASSSRASIAPDYTVNLGGGEKVTITTDLSVPQGTNLGTTTVTIGGSTCTGPTTSILSTGIVTITCIAPAKSAGDYDVVVEIPSYGKTYTIYNGFSYKALYNYTLSYNANGGTNPPTSQTATNISNTSYEFTITNTKPTRSGYVFKGWSTSSSSTTVSYTSGNKITLNSTNPTRTLYAVWEIAGIKTLINMQDMTSAICNASAIGDSVTLKDTRDSKYYTVKKLADGKCWMTQNLRLTGNKTLYPSDSDVTSNFTLPAVDTGTWCQANNATCHNKALHRLSDQSGSTGTSYGAYYNWYAATAGTGTYEKSSGNATSSICPKGWRLPTGGPGGEFQALYTAIGSTPANITSTSGGNPGFVFSGVYGDSSFGGVGTNGSYWSSTAYSNGNAYRLYFNSSSVLPQDSLSKYYGGSVRCVAK